MRARIVQLEEDLSNSRQQYRETSQEVHMIVTPLPTH